MPMVFLLQPPAENKNAQVIWEPTSVSQSISKTAWIPSSSNGEGEPQPQVGSSYILLADNFNHRLQKKAHDALRDYLDWYENFVTSYQGGLQKNGKARPGRLRQGREGIEKLRMLSARVTIQSDEQLEKFLRILQGYRAMSQYTTDMNGRGALIPVLVNNLMKALAANHLITMPLTFGVDVSRTLILKPISMKPLIIDLRHVVAA